MAEENQVMPNEGSGAPEGAPATGEQPGGAEGTQGASAGGAQTAPVGDGKAEQENLMGETLLGSGENAAEGETTQEEGTSEADNVPETYEAFKDVDGNEYSPDSVRQFSEAAKKVGLSQEKAQTLFEAMVPTAKAHMMSDLRSKAEQWALDCEKDPEIGGANFGANKAVAIAGYREFATPELRTILNASGLGNHPEVVRHFYRLGKTLQQDKGVYGNASTAPQRRRRYPKSDLIPDE